MRRSGVSGAMAALLLIAGILIGVTGFYAASSNQTGPAQTRTVTMTITSAATVTQTFTPTPPVIVASCSQAGNPSQQINCSLDNVAAGDLIVVEFSDVAAVTLSDSLKTQFTPVAQVNLPSGSYVEFASYGRANASGVDVISVSGGGNYPSMIVREIHGADSLEGFSTGSSSITGETSVSNVSSFSPPIGTFVLAALLPAGHPPPLVTQGQGYTLGLTAANTLLTDEFAVSTGATTSPFTLNPASNWAEISMAFG